MENNINFIFSKIETLQFATFDIQVEKSIDFDFGVNTEFSVNDIERTIIVTLDLSFFQNKFPFVKLEVACYFNIIEDSWNTFINKNKIKIPADFARHLLMLTVGTSRGILHSKTENTEYKNIVLPTINLTEIIKENIIFDMIK